MKKAIIIMALLILTQSIFSISFDDVQLWAGEGSNQAIFVIDWQDDEPAMMWGYNYTYMFTGSEMINAVVAADDRLSFDGTGFVNDLIYVENGDTLHIGLHGDPNYWSLHQSDVTDGSDLSWSHYGGLNFTIMGNNKAIGASYGTADPASSASDIVAATNGTPEETYSFDDITYWVGEGSKQAGFVIDWVDDKEPRSLVWGYRWDGDATGLDMAQAIVEADPRLSADTDAIFQLAKYDLDNDGDIDENDHSWDEANIASDFWAYYLKENSDSSWAFSGSGISGRNLENGCWDGWIFVEDWGAMPYPTFQSPTPAEVPVVEEELSFDEIEAWVGEGSNVSMLVIDFNDGDEPQSYAWGYRYDGSPSAEDMMNAIVAADPRVTIGITSGFLNDIELDLDQDGTPEYTSVDGGDYWSTWSKAEESDWSMNSGCSTGMSHYDRFGCSYGFTPAATAPDNPVAVPALPVVEEELSFDDLEAWVGEGANVSMLVIDFNDGDEPQSYAWGYRYDGSPSAEDMMNAIVAADPRVTIGIASGFLNDIELDLDQDGTPEYTSVDGGDYWSTWSKAEDSDWSMNSGCSTGMSHYDRFGCSYGFTPAATAPDNPVAVPALPVVEEVITFDDIQYWVGEGENQAGLVIDWQDGLEPKSIAWGFRWNGTANGQEMLNAIIAADLRLSGDGDLPSLIQYDLNNDGTIDENDHDENGDMSDNNFWAYYTGSDAATWTFATTNHAGRTLVDGEWDGWSYIADWGAMPYPDIANATPAEAPTVEENLDFAIIEYWVGEGTNETAMVIDWNDDNDPESMVWGYRWDGDKTTLDMFNDIVAADMRLSTELTSGLLNGVFYDFDNNGTLDENDHNQAGNGSIYWAVWSDDENDGWSSGGAMSATSLVDGGLQGFSWSEWMNEVAPETPVPAGVNPDNHAPIALDDMVSIKNTQAVTIRPLFNDTDEDNNINLNGLTICVDPQNGTAETVNNGTINYTPETDFVGVDSLIYTISDNGGLVSDSAVVVINIFEPFTGQAGTADCDAIPAESDEFVAWASNVEVTRGYINISNPDLGQAAYGEASGAIGQAEGNSMDVVSLGDSGVAIATFDNPICNEDGPDFAVFENSFNNTFLELAFVEVSSDGTNFFRFPATSLTQTYEQIGDVNAVWAEDLNNLAGKHKQGFGTPFDLEELSDIEGLDINNVTHVKIIDAIGSINPEFASYDSHGNIINDPWPTEAGSCGFDLDAIGVIHSNTVGNEDAEQFVTQLNSSYPNPFTPGHGRSGVNIAFSLKKADNVNIKIYNVKGQLVKSVCNDKFTAGAHTVQWNGQNNHGKSASSGVYFYRMETKEFKG